MGTTASINLRRLERHPAAAVDRLLGRRRASKVYRSGDNSPAAGRPAPLGRQIARSRWRPSLLTVPGAPDADTISSRDQGQEAPPRASSLLQRSASGRQRATPPVPHPLPIVGPVLGSLSRKRPLLGALVWITSQRLRNGTSSTRRCALREDIVEHVAYRCGTPEACGA